MGYKIALCYYNPSLFKTNAKADVIYDIFKKYKTDNYQKENLFKNIDEKSYKYKLLKKEIIHKPTFYEIEDNLHQAKFLSNPTKNWGPKSRAKLVKYATNIITNLKK